MKRILLYTCLIFLPSAVFAQTLNWANPYSSPESTSRIIKVVMAPDGNIVTAGKFKGTLDFDLSSSVAELTSVSIFDNYFIMRNAPDGSFISVIQLSGHHHERVGLAIDSDNNSYSLSLFKDSFDFDPSSEVAELIPSAQANAVLAKYDSAGGLVWAKQLGSAGYIDPKALTIDAAGNLYASMDFAIDISYDSQELYTELSTTQRSVLLKIDPSGNVIRHGLFDENTKINNMAMSPSGKLYTVGTYFGTSDFDLTDSEFPLTANGSWDAFMSVYNEDGSIEDAFSIGKGQSDAANSLAFYPNNDVVMVGQYKTQIDCTPNGNGAGLSTGGAKDGSFIAKYDAGLNLIWQKQIGFSAHTFNADVAIDSEGNVCTVGWFNGTANFDPLDTYVNQGITSQNRDGFVSKLNSAGEYVFGGAFASQYDTELAATIAAGTNGSIYIGGKFGLSIDIDPSDGEHILNGIMSENGFLIKMDNFAVSTPSIMETGTLNAYPNPSTGKFTIQSSTDLKNQNIFVYNQLGQKVNAHIVKSGNEITFQVEGAKGIYFLEILGESGSRSTAKLIKE